MRKITAILLAISLIFCLCACGHKDDGDAERKCGVYVTVKADDIYAVSCGTEKGSDSASPAEGGKIPAGQEYHFDFAGDAAKGSKSAVIPYMICIYDKDFNVITEASFEDDFSNMAQVNIVVTEDHEIIYKGGKVNCGGKVVVSLEQVEDSLGVNVAKVSVSVAGNEEAGDKITDAMAGLVDSFTANTEANRASYTENVSGKSGEIPAFAMSEDVTVPRGDKHIVCFRVRDYVYLGTQEISTYSAHNFDVATGTELSLTDVFTDVDKLISACTEYILISTTDDGVVYNEGFTDAIPNLVKDGNWFFDKDGIVIIANQGDIADKGHEFHIPYSDIEKYVKEDYLPEEYDEICPCSISAVYADDKSADKFTFVGNEGDDLAEGDIIVTASGDISNIGVYTVAYNADSNSYGLVRQLFYCSDLHEGGSFAINAQLESTANILVQYTTAYGTVTNNLLSADENGGICITDPDGGSKGIDIMNDLPFSLDLNGDGNDDEISIKGGKVNITSGANSASFDTGLDKITVALLHDSDCDGNFELFAGGDMASDDYIVYCLKFDGKTIKDIPFDGEDFVCGDIQSFAANKLCVNSVADILGTYSCLRNYEYSDGKFHAADGSSCKINTDQYIVTKADIALAEGGTIASGTEVRVTGTDFESFVSIEAKDGTAGKLNLSKNSGDTGWLINGTPEAELFQSLPYAG